MGYEEPEEDYEEPRGMGMKRKQKKQPKYNDRVDETFAYGWGSATDPTAFKATGRGGARHFEWGHGAGNHSPWHSEIYRHDAGMLSYRFRPKSDSQYHTPVGYGRNMWL